MGRTGGFIGKSVEADIKKWVSVGGGTDREGNVIEKPLILQNAELIDGLCQRYSVLPSQLVKEDVGLLRLMHIVSLGIKDKDG
tara:strand:+ start:4060 stop:4308 length:249 start_codon:yes stop_codon:yes gene_type:complete